MTNVMNRNYYTLGDVLLLEGAVEIGSCINDGSRI